MKPQFYYSVNIFVRTLEMDLVRKKGLNRNMFLERVSSLETHLEILVIILTTIQIMGLSKHYFFNLRKITYTTEDYTTYIYRLCIQNIDYIAKAITHKF